MEQKELEFHKHIISMIRRFTRCAVDACKVMKISMLNNFVINAKGNGNAPLPIFDAILIVNPKKMRARINSSALLRLLQKLCRILPEEKVNPYMKPGYLDKTLNKNTILHTYPSSLVC